jgi:hypothetical protein
MKLEIEKQKEKTIKAYESYRHSHMKRKIGAEMYKQFIKSSFFNIDLGFNFCNLYQMKYNNKTKQISYKDSKFYGKCFLPDFQLKRDDYNITVCFNGFKFEQHMEESVSSKYIFDFLYEWITYLELVEEYKKPEIQKRVKFKL